MKPTIRRAVVRGGLNATLEDVRNYLPSNYTAYEYFAGEFGSTIVIEGTDDHGWTLDGYVIPRLGSALIAVEEVTS